jgi:sterol desaturase/sphingolipid hydroxylase (fatty acid hydroxylase superfamily)
LFPNPIAASIWGMFVAFVGTWLVSNLGFSFLYWLSHPFIEQYKVEKDKEWPFRNPVTRGKWFRDLALLVVVYVGHQALSFGGMYLLAIRRKRPVNLLPMGPDDIPDPYMVLMVFTGSTALYEFFFFVGHRIMHTKYMYQFFHKMHHVNPSTSWIGAYHHPVDSFLVHTIPLTFVIMLFRMHLYSQLVLAVLFTNTGVDEHCGYDLPFSPWRMWAGFTPADLHYFHHTHFLNYATNGIWDQVFGMAKGWNAHLRALYPKDAARYEDARQLRRALLKALCEVGTIVFSLAAVYASRLCALADKYGMAVSAAEVHTSATTLFFISFIANVALPME